MLFSYKAIDQDGQIKKGKLDATDKNAVIAHIKAQRMQPMEVRMGGSSDFAAMLPRKKTSAKDMSMFCEQFCALIRAGVTIVDALKLLNNQLEDRSLKEGVQGTIMGVNEGETLGDSMARTGVFDETFISLVRAGEASGSLDKSLERMSEQYEKDAAIAAAIKKALSYPIVVLVIAVIVVIFMLVYIVPAFMNMFADIGIECLRLH